MRVMGLDVGSKTVGVAISDPLGFTAQGVEIIKINEEASKAYGDKIKEIFNLPVDYQDERLTTVQAERMLVEQADVSRDKRKKVIDKLAAQLILQNYLARMF